MALISRFGASAGVLAALSLIASPAAAADLPQRAASHGGAALDVFGAPAFGGSIGDIAIGGESVDWGGCGYRCRYRHRHRGVDGGDVLAGVLILGGIAAIASAANNNRKRQPDVVIIERRDRDEDPRDREYDRDDDKPDYDKRDEDRRDYDRNYVPREGDYGERAERSYDRRSGGQSSRGLEGAVDQCVAEIERTVRVESVDAVDRTSGGWIVSGALGDGSGFTCAIDNNGRIDAIDYRSGDRRDLGAAEEPYRGNERADGQWDDNRYYAARDASGRSNARQPAYPGGPLPGEDYSE